MWDAYDDELLNPYAGYDSKKEEWIQGWVAKEFLEEHFGHCQSLDDCIQTTESAELRLFFEHLKAQL